MAKAYINWGRWIVDCACNSGILLVNYPSQVQCKACQATIEVEYPPTRQRIEAVLAHRPPTRAGSQDVFNHQNWRPGESIADLKRENREHGLPNTEDIR